MRTLITGGAGFIGSSLSGTHRIVSREPNLLNYIETESYFAKNSFSNILHCAANISSAQIMKRNHHVYLIENLQIDLNVLEASRVTKVDNLLVIGSISGLKPNSKGVIDEECLIEGPATSINYGYNFEKFIQPYLVETYQKDFGLNYKSVLLSNCYGPGALLKDDAPLVSSLISQILRARSLDIDLNLYGTGEDLRNLTYLGDLDLVFKQHMTNSKNTEPIIVASPYILKIREIVEIITDLLKFSNKIEFTEYDSNSTRNNKICSNNKLMSLGYEVKWTSPEEGLRITIERLGI